MIIFVVAVLLTVGVLGLIFRIRVKDLPEPLPVSPFQHLDDRKAAIYENLRDLQFEYRVGKLSDQDYQQTKVTLQGELAGVLSEIDRMKQGLANMPTPPAKSKPTRSPKPGTVCPHCGAKFAQPLKFCGECGKAMA